MKQFNPWVIVMVTYIVGLFYFSCSEKTTDAQQAISLDQAEEIILANVLNGDDSGIVVYELPTQMEEGAIVSTVSLYPVSYTAPTDSWFFFIDDQPGYRWTHDCRYAFVSCSTGKPTVYNEGWPPDNFDSLKVVTFQ